MKFKKIVSLVLGCILVMNPSVTGFAFTENDDVDVTVKVNNLEKQLIRSEAEKNFLKSKIKNAELNNQKAFENNIEELKKQNKKLKKSIAAKDASSTISWLGSFLGIFDILLKMGVLVTGSSLYLASKFEKPSGQRSWWKFWSKSSKDSCPIFFIPFRDYGTAVYDGIRLCVLKTLKNEEIQRQLEEIFKKSIPNCATKKGSRR